jgi:hypothetical protein
MADKKSDSNILAGLCYVPFLLINFIAIGYVLLAKKGGKHAKYHALQSLFLNICWMFVGTALVLLVFIPQSMEKMGTLQQKFLAASEEQKNLVMIGAMTDYYAGMVPFLALSIVPLAVFLLLAILVAMGKDIRIPVLGSFINRFV